ncbi:MAG TPA: lmo0937 family membrane protein [Terriglobia bacterium]|nr:lmo0937 family membrane protein [Terriglobia bacterium]
MASDGDGTVCMVHFRVGKKEMVMFLILFIVLLVAWLLGFVAFHVAGGLIHLLLIIAVICLIVHFARGRRVA